MVVQKRHIPSFARRVGKQLRDTQKRLIAELLPTITIKSAQDVHDLAKKYDSMSLEIGFGNGEFIFNYANNNSNNICIGCEPYINGIAALLGKLKNSNIKNIRIFPDDVRLILDSDDKEIFNDVFIICPDPWPKTRHNKRRIINTTFLGVLHDKLKVNGTLHIVTDHFGYADWIHEMLQNSIFALQTANINEHLLKETDWFYTKYQRKGLEQQSEIYYFRVKRLLATSLTL